MRDQIAANRRRASLLLIGVAVAVVVVFGVVGLLVDALWQLVVAGLVVALAILAGAYWGSERLVLALSGARPADRATQPRLFNLVDGLCVASGLRRPNLYVVDDPAPNALTV